MLYVGIDPGLTMTGIVIKDGDGNILLHSTLTAAKKKYPLMTDHERAASLATAVAELVFDYNAVVCIETPVYNRNPRGFALQCMLVGMLIENLGWLSPLVLVGPTQVKAHHTGSGKASKLDMICAGSFDGPGFAQDVQEALADAEAICDYGRAHEADARLLDADKHEVTLFTGLDPDVDTESE
jgi:Holliday junction resolvasome RuvABC endonuclease subunit